MSDYISYYYAFALILVLIGLIIITVNLYFYNKNRLIKEWIITNATILESKIDVNKNLRKEKYEDHYKANVVYKYAVDDKEIISNRVSFNNDIYLPYDKKAKKLCVKYPKGKLIQVYYNPNNPNDSVIESVPIAYLKKNIIIAVLIAIIGIVIFYYKQQIEEVINSNFL